MTDTLVNSSTLTGTPRTLSQQAGTAAYHVVPAAGAKQVWEEIKQPWSATPQGRLAIRTISRGVMGAAFYAWGTQKAVKDMAGYNADNPQNALQHLARGIDKVVGAPMIKVLDKVGLNGKEIVSFRPTLKGGARTLGHDVIFNTFDFAMASTGDALGRNIIGLFDKGVEKKWKDENGKIVFPKAVKHLALTAGRVFEAQAEDWFVSIPYTFQQKFQRKLINKVSPGFEYSADSTLNGSSFKLDENSKVIGTYAWEGALDLQGRFTGYNFGTAIFRDLSKATKSKVKDMLDPEKRAEKEHKPLHITPVSMFNAGQKGVLGASRYLINRAVKTTLVMTPSIPLFSLLRIPQSKHRGIGIMPDGSEVDLAARADFNPYDDTYSRLDGVLNPFGKAASTLSAGAVSLSRRAARASGADANGEQYAANLAESYVNGAIAYTPYIYAKNEFAHHWDNPDMDAAIYKAIDGVFSANFKEVKEGIGGIRHALKFRNAKTVREDKQHDQERPCNFSDKVGKREEGDRKFADKLSRPNSANWQEQVQQRGEPELSNSR